jgi:hypothetical protein
MKRIANTLATLSLLISGFVGCTPDFDVPPIKVNKYEGKETMSILDFKNKYKNVTLEEITENIVLHGIINASDSSGNIYKKIFFQDLNGTAGLELSVEASTSYNVYNLGQEIFIECKGLYIGKSNDVLQLGTPFKDKYGKITIGRMPLFYANKHIFRHGKINKSNVKIRTINSISELNDGMVDCVVTINNIFFTSGGLEIFANKPIGDNTYPTSREIADLKGGKTTVYTSGYANFAKDKLPKGMGSITCIASQYRGAWQLMIRDRTDIGTFDGTDIDPNISITVSSLNETFDAGTDNSSASINGWCVFKTVGDRDWQTKLFKNDNNKYAQATAHTGASADYEYWLVTPGLDLDAATQKLIAFETSMTYWKNTSSLEIYLMNDKDPAKATKELLNVKIATETDAENQWIPSGTIDLSAKSGVVYVGFRYRAKGGASNSTTFRVDNFKFGSSVQ